MQNFEPINMQSLDPLERLPEDVVFRILKLLESPAWYVCSTSASAARSSIILAAACNSTTAFSCSISTRLFRSGGSQKLIAFAVVVHFRSSPSHGETS